MRTTNAIERLHEEFKRRIKTQCLLPCAETAAMLFWALLASGQITLRRVDGWQTLAHPPAILTSPPDQINHARQELRRGIPTNLTTRPVSRWVCQSTRLWICMRST